MVAAPRRRPAPTPPQPLAPHWPRVAHINATLMSDGADQPIMHSSVKMQRLKGTVMLHHTLPNELAIRSCFNTGGCVKAGWRNGVTLITPQSLFACSTPQVEETLYLILRGDGIITCQINQGMVRIQMNDYLQIHQHPNQIFYY